MYAMCLTGAARIERMRCVSGTSRTLHIASCYTYNLLLCHTWYTATCCMQCIAASYIAYSILLCTMYCYVLCTRCASHTTRAPQVAIHHVWHRCMTSQYMVYSKLLHTMYDEPCIVMHHVLLWQSGTSYSHVLLLLWQCTSQEAQQAHCIHMYCYCYGNVRYAWHMAIHVNTMCLTCDARVERMRCVRVRHIDSVYAKRIGAFIEQSHYNTPPQQYCNTQCNTHYGKGKRTEKKCIYTLAATILQHTLQHALQHALRETKTQREEAHP